MKKQEKKSNKKQKKQNSVKNKKLFGVEFAKPNGWLEVVILIAVGLFVGFVNGFLGSGGGILLVPILAFLVRGPTKVAHATAVVVILPVCIASGIVYFARGFIDVLMSAKVLIGTIAGGILGTFLLKRLASDWISIIFALVMVGVGVKIVFF